MEIYEKAWKDILSIIQTEINSITYSAWFKPTKIHSVDNNTIILSALAEPHKEKLQDYISLIRVASAEVYHRPMNIEIYTKEELELPAAEVSSYFTEDSSSDTGLNPKFSFKNFVEGSSNRHAYAASYSVAENPCSGHYNPLFIYGDSGLGKTHLMQAIGNYVVDKHSEMKTLYVSCEQFLNDFVSHLQAKKMDMFNEKYRKNIDLLLIDDIQTLIGKKECQKEFFNIFNELKNMEKQIVIVSDRPPNEFNKDLPKRFTSRFSQGLIVDVSPPEFETRAAIINQKAENENINLPNNVILYIAEAINSNIRSLEGALSKILAYTRLNNEPITLEVAKNELKEYVTNDNNFKLTQDIIKQAVADHFKTTVEDLNSSSKKKLIAEARKVAMFLCRELLNETYETIGDNFNRNHSTVIHAVKCIEAMMNEGVSLSKDVEDIKNKFVQ